jgi:(2R)-3-sulfolactate dehydrogenase (NADP+)
LEKVTVSLNDIQAKTEQALVAHGAKLWIAQSVAQAVRKAEEVKNLICGLYYLDSYCTQLKTGRVDGSVEPEVTMPKASSVKVDAKLGFAQAAFSRGLEQAIDTAKNHGNATLAICHSHTCTSMGYFTEQISNAGLIGIGMTNAPACVSPPGGTKAVLGTNPISMSVPAQNGGVAFTFDQSTSAIAIGKIRVAAAAGEKIPLGWAVDPSGNLTDDPNEALKGSLVSAGGYKGYGFGLMAEILAAAVTGSLNSVSAPPLKTPEGPAHDLGQFYFLVDPTTFSGDDFWSRLETISEAVSEQEGARLPGSAKEPVNEVSVDAALWDSVLALAAK